MNTNTRNKIRGLALAPVALALTLSMATPSHAAQKDPATTKQRSGQAAVDFLGKGIDKAAKSAHLSPAKLKETLHQDKTLKVDDHGHLFYADQAPEQSGTATITDSVTAPVYATTDTFQLHSKPSAPMK